MKKELFDRLCDSIDGHFGLATDFRKYQEDPVGFGEEILGETYTEDVKRKTMRMRKASQKKTRFRT